MRIHARGATFFVAAASLILASGASDARPHPDTISFDRWEIAVAEVPDEGSAIQVAHKPKKKINRRAKKRSRRIRPRFEFYFDLPYFGYGRLYRYPRFYRVPRYNYGQCQWAHNYCASEFRYNYREYDRCMRFYGCR